MGIFFEQHKCGERVTPRYPLIGIKKSLEKIVIASSILLSTGGFGFGIHKYINAPSIGCKPQNYTASFKTHVNEVTDAGVYCLMGGVGLIGLFVGLNSRQMRKEYEERGYIVDMT